MAQMGKDKSITLKNLERICKALDCPPKKMYFIFIMNTLIGKHIK